MRNFCLLTLLLLLALPANAQDWVSYVDESSTRISADAAVGIDDEEEKDLIVGDVDRDGDDDLIIARKTPFSTPGGKSNVLFLNELGTMVDRTSTYIPGFADLTDDRDIVLVDVDDDGWLDIVTVTTFSEQPRIYMNLGNAAPENGEGPGGWLGFEYDPEDERLPQFDPAPKFCAVGFGDVTGDEKPDLFFVDYDNNLEDRLLINDGNGFFTDETATRMTAEMSESVFGTDSHIIDVNGDGWNDLLKNSSSGSAPPPGSTQPSVRIIYNDGTGNFDHIDFAYTIAPYMVEPGDFNNDGRVDIFVVDDGQDRYMINTGNDVDGHAEWSIQTVTNSPNTTFFGGNTKVADLDADGVQDVLVTDVDTDIPGCNRELVLLQGDLSAGVSLTDPLNGASRAWLTNGTYDIEIFDIDHDGNLDLWNGICDGNRVFMNQSGDGIFWDGFESNSLDWWSGTIGM